MILIVDDNEQLARALSTALKKRGYKGVTASNGGEAYAHLKSGSCQCMLLDICMPDINGIELLLLMQSEGIKTPTIVMTGFSDFEEEELSQFDSVVAFRSKPFLLADMMALVSEHTHVCDP
jgi:two-component system, NtrC family, response regulator AtoC